MNMNINLTQEQQNIIEQILKFPKKIITTGGFAGTGKTTLITYLAEELPNFAICAFTGKAANVLRKKGLNEARTIHSLIYKPVETKHHVHWELKGFWELDVDGFIVDEASMISKEIYEDLLSFDKPIIFVGDHGQLEPVGQDVFLMKNPDFKLEQIHRNAGEIAHFANWLREGNPAIGFQNHPLHKGKVKFLTNYEAVLLLLNTDQIICAFNKTRVSLNRQVRQIKGFGEMPQIGDKVMCLRNNRQNGLFNGMQGIIKSVHYTKKPKMTFESDLENYKIKFDINQFNKEKYDFSSHRDDPDPFDFAYAITCHKAQGDEWNRVMVFEQYCSKWDHRRWTYTAASRAMEEVLWVYR